MQRFLVTPQTMAADSVVLNEATSRQIAVVLRMRLGDTVILCDGRGREALCRLEHLTPRQVTVRVEQRAVSTVEAALRLHLYPALIRAPRFELILQKATELGVDAITPVLCRRSVARSPAEAVPERWRNIVREAFEQSARGRLPDLAEPVSF
ncbi:MAG TPA: RsmE family RNA methyltransferase, partial [Chloroflexota bacterium]